MIYPGTRIDPSCTIYPGAVIGRPPQRAGTWANEAWGKTRIGEGSVIGANAVIYAGVWIGDRVLIGDGATIREGCSIGDDSIVGNNCTFQNDVVMGQRSRVIDLSHITAGVVIGDDVFISTGVLTMNDNDMARGDVELAAPSFADHSRVGGGAIILPGIEVKADSLVAAGAVVTRDVETQTRVQGVPARPYDDPDQLWRDFYFRESDANPDD